MLHIFSLAPSVKLYQFPQAEELHLCLSNSVPIPSSAGGQHGREKMGQIFTPEFKLTKWD